MNGARNAHADRAAAATGLASWYVPGHADGFGDRLLMFDNTSTPSLELLRFHRELTATPGFEEALRERVRRLSAFQHHAFASVKAVQYLDDGAALALVSVHAQGQRLSEIFDQRPRKGLNPTIVTWMLRELTPALAALQEESQDVAHGALTPDRVVLTADGRLCIVEHVLGSALLALNRAPAALWREFSICAPADADGIARLDPATDVAQLAAVALSMLLARPLSLQDIQQRLPALLDEFSEAASIPALTHHVSPLRLWFERALHVGGSGYLSAADAEYDVGQLPSHDHTTSTVAMSPRRQLSAGRTLSQPATVTATEPEPLSRPMLRSVPRPEESRVPASDREPLEAFPSESTEPVPPTPVTVRASTETAAPRSTPAPSATREKPAVPSPTMSADTRSIRNERGRSWLVVAMALAIVAQTAVIALLVTRPLPTPISAVVIESSQPGDTVIVNGQTVGKTPLPLTVGTEIKSVLVKSSAPPGVALSGHIDPETPAKREPVKGTTETAAIVPTRPNFGGVKLISPIELKVFEGNEALGSSSDGRIALSPGVHNLELVNSQVGYRSTHSATVKAGESVVIKLTVPDGVLSVNAQPWANCALDKKDIGETPLANLKVALGEHELVCRNPKLGERKQMILVRQNEPTKVGVKFDQ